MAKEWKKVQRADSDFSGNVTGKINNVVVSNVYTTSNKPSKSDVGLGNLDNVQQYSSSNKPTKGDVGLGNVDNESKSSILGGTFTGNIGGTSAADIRAKAIAGESAKDAVDGNKSITMVGGSLSIGTQSGGVYPFSVDTAGNLKIKNDEFQALADGTVNCKGNFTINQDSNGDSKIVLAGDATGTAEVEVNGANPTFDLGGASPLGTSTLFLKRKLTSNQSRIQFQTGTGSGSMTNQLNIGVSNNTINGRQDQYAIHYGPIWSSGTAHERALSFDYDGKMGMYANTKTVAGFTFGSDGTNKHVYIKNGGLGIGTTIISNCSLNVGNHVTINGDLDVGTDAIFNGQVDFDGDTSGISYNDLSSRPTIPTACYNTAQWSAQVNVLNNRYYMPNNVYGAGYYLWNRYLTSIPSSLAYSSGTYGMPIHIPKAGKIVKWGFNGIGNSSQIGSTEWRLYYATMSASATTSGTLAQVGSTVTVNVATAGRNYEWKQGSLSHTVAEDGILLPISKGSATSTKYLRGSFYVVYEYTI